MFDLSQLSSIAFIVCLMCYQPAAAEPSDFAARQEAWGKVLDQRKFEWPDNYCGLCSSLPRFIADCEVHMIYHPKNYRPKDKWSFEIRFVRDNREVVSLPGHLNSAFTSFEDTLFFAKYPTGTTGCTILAYDLTTGKKLWETDMRGPKPIGHSAYANSVTIRMSNVGEVKGEPAGAAVIVTGRESYTDYVEVLDRQTGASLAVKNYRTGFEPSPPTGGGFDGRNGSVVGRGYGGPGGINKRGEIDAPNADP